MYVWENQSIYFPKMCTDPKDVVETWLKTLRHIREILFKLKKKVCMYVTGMLFEGSKRQIHSKSRISGLVSKFCCGSWGRKFFHFLQP